MWTSISNASWIRVTSGASGTGRGATNYIVDPNPGGPRTGTISSAGKLLTVAQEGSSTWVSITGIALGPNDVITYYYRVDRNLGEPRTVTIDAAGNIMMALEQGQ